MAKIPNQVENDSLESLRQKKSTGREARAFFVF
jgi:hypothetical protein